jgi:serpin B
MLRLSLVSRLLVLFCVPLLAFCSAAGTETDNPVAPDGIDFLRSSKAYLSSVEVPDADRQGLEQGNQAFALDLYREIAASAATDENLFLSPYSVSTVMAMTYAGARAETESQMASALHFDLAQDELHPAMNQLSQHFNALNELEDLELRTVNSIWLQDGYPVQDSYLDLLSQQYDTGVYLADFESDAESARQSINQWVSEQTEQRIEELFPESSISGMTALALTNAVYFSALWENRFDKERTEPGLFTLPDDDQVTVDMMQRTIDFSHSITPDWRAVELPYRDANLSMICILPNPGEFAEFEAELDRFRLLEIIDAMDEPGGSLSLYIPKFSFESAIDLETAMQNLGMTDAFSVTSADFSGISGDGLYVDAALHKTFIGIDEDGTVAAGATGEVLVPMSINPRIRLDRPFLFLIWDHDTRTVLFLGRLVRPEGKVVGRAEPLPSDAEAICGFLDRCQDRALTLDQCVASFDSDDPEVVNRCADCYRAELDLGGGSTFRICEQGPVCVDECPAHAF